MDQGILPSTLLHGHPAGAVSACIPLPSKEAITSNHYTRPLEATQTRTGEATTVTNSNRDARHVATRTPSATGSMNNMPRDMTNLNPNIRRTKTTNQKARHMVTKYPIGYDALFAEQQRHVLQHAAM